jgi:hypothetical protein
MTKRRTPFLKEVVNGKEKKGRSENGPPPPAL